MKHPIRLAVCLALILSPVAALPVFAQGTQEAQYLMTEIDQLRGKIRMDTDKLEADKAELKADTARLKMLQNRLKRMHAQPHRASPPPPVMSHAPQPGDQIHWDRDLPR